MAEESRCPIFKATGEKPLAVIKHKDAAYAVECDICPFRDNCPEDTMNEAISKVLETISGYMYTHSLARFAAHYGMTVEEVEGLVDRYLYDRGKE